MREQLPPWVADLGIFLFLSLGTVFSLNAESAAGFTRPDRTFAILQVIQLLTILTWRRFPAISVLVLAGAWIVERHLIYEPNAVSLVPAIVFFGLAVTSPPQRWRGAAVVAAAAMVAYVGLGWPFGATGFAEFAGSLAITGGAALAGRWWRKADPDTTAIPVPGRHLPTIPARVFDLAVFGVLSAIAVAFPFYMSEELMEGFRSFDLWFVILQALQLGTLLLLAWRRHLPAAMALASAAWIVERIWTYPPGPTTLVLPILLYNVGALLPRDRSERVGWTASASIVGFTALGLALDPTVDVADFLSTTAITVTPFLMGRRRHYRTLQLELAEVRAEQAERERDEATHRAVIDERARIARELHDVVAHQVTVMTMQAKGAGRLAADADTRVGDALATIESAGHQALVEMRRMVGLLRGPDQDELAPQPNLARLDALIDGMREAGLDVELETEGDLGNLPEGIGLSAYRIIQESLTNTLKHGGEGVTARVSVRRVDDTVVIEVSDDGLGPGPDGGGHGLIGMQERASLVGGRLEVGPSRGGGFRVAAELPVEST